MKITKLKTILAAACMMVGVLFTGGSVFANTPSISLSPMYQRIVLLPGETYRGSLSVVNPSSSTEDLHYKAEVGPYSPLKDDNGDYSGADTTTVTDYNQIMNWITIDNPEGTVAPNKSETLSFSVKVPENAPAGGQYATIIVGSAEDYNNNTNNSAAIKSYVNIAHIIYADVAGETIQKGSITENNMPTMLTNNELKATSMVRNDGNVHTDATYTLQVWPMFSDEEICTNEEKAETSLIMPNTERYHVQSCILPSVGIFKAKQVVSIFGEQSVLEKTIVVCPIWLMILILIIICAIIGAIIYIVKKHKNSKKGVDVE